MAQSSVAVKNVAQMPAQKAKAGAVKAAPGEPRIRKDGQPYAERGEALRWNEDRDAALVAALTDGTVTNLVQLSKALFTSPAFATVQHLITVPRLRTRVGQLRAYQKEQGAGEIIPARFEKTLYRPDMKALRAVAAGK